MDLDQNNLINNQDLLNLLIAYNGANSTFDLLCMLRVYGDSYVDSKECALSVPVFSERKMSIKAVHVATTAYGDTYELYVQDETGQLSLPSSFNVWAMYATDDKPIELPPAYQSAVGVDFEGVNPAFFSPFPDAEFDSYLSLLGMDGSRIGEISQVQTGGMAAWAADTGVTITSMAFHCTDTTDALFGAPDPIGRITIAAGATEYGKLNLAGSFSKLDSKVNFNSWYSNIEFQIGPPP